MVRLSTCLLLSTVLLLAQVFHLAEANKCCPGDSTCSGCWMCPGSDLRDCWDDAVKEIDDCHITDDLKESANAFCRGFAKLAKCWKAGRCCSEYSPLLAAATNLCNLKTWETHQISRWDLENVVRIANATREAIWHNDSGIKVPKLSPTIKAYSSSSESQSYHYQSSSYSTSSKYEHTHNKNGHSYFQKSVAPSAEETGSDSQDEPAQKTDPASHQAQLPQHHDSKHASQAKTYVEHKKNVHHQAKCASNPKKCQSHTAKQYHDARSHHTYRKSHPHSKRVENALHKRAPYHIHNPEVYKRTEEGDEGCGLDFQGVPYPKGVPDTVAHIFAEL